MKYLKKIIILLCFANISFSQISNNNRNVYHRYIQMHNQNMNDITRNYIIDKVDYFASKYGVPKSLVFATMRVESNFNMNAKSNANAFGLMQITKVLEKDYNMDRLNVSNNIEMGVLYLRRCMNQFGITNNTVAAYNRGINKVRNSGYSNIRETTNHVKKIQKELNKLNNMLYLNNNFRYNNQNTFKSNSIRFRTDYMKRSMNIGF